MLWPAACGFSIEAWRPLPLEAVFGMRSVPWAVEPLPLLLYPVAP